MELQLSILTLAEASMTVVGLLAAGFVAVCLLMMLVILIQKPKGGGLSGAFGGAGGSASDVFGAKTGDVLTYVTVAFFLAFLILGVSLTFATRSNTMDEREQRRQQMQDPPAVEELVEGEEAAAEAIELEAEAEAALEEAVTDTPDAETPAP